MEIRAAVMEALKPLPLSAPLTHLTGHPEHGARVASELRGALSIPTSPW